MDVHSTTNGINRYWSIAICSIDLQTKQHPQLRRHITTYPYYVSASAGVQQLDASAVGATGGGGGGLQEQLMCDMFFSTVHILYG